jgi:hypothetical protein
MEDPDAIGVETFCRIMFRTFATKSYYFTVNKNDDFSWYSFQFYVKRKKPITTPVGNCTKDRLIILGFLTGPLPCFNDPLPPPLFHPPPFSPPPPLHTPPPSFSQFLRAVQHIYSFKNI